MIDSQNENPGKRDLLNGVPLCDSFCKYLIMPVFNIGRTFYQLFS